MVAPVEESVPPKQYGGTELVVYNIITELVNRGHQVTLFGTGDSEVPCPVVPVFPQSIRTIEPYASDPKSRDAAKYVGISKVIDSINTNHFDIVHNHIGWRFLLFAELLKNQKVITTMHGPLSLPYQYMGFKADPSYQFVSISDNQRKDCPDLHYAATVYNGIDPTLFPFSDTPEDYLFILGRMSPEKGVKEAIEVAKKSGQKLIIAAKIDHVDTAYWNEVKPMIDGEQIKFIGEVGLEEKTKLLMNAKALLAPIQWEEPFGLNVVEAMVSGTPVLGMRRGSFPELVVQGVTGYLEDTVDALADHVKEIGSINRHVCRKHVEDHFTKQHMADGYLRVYEGLLH